VNQVTSASLRYPLSVFNKNSTLKGCIEGMSQLFYIWKDKQTIQGICQFCIWKDKQNQGKALSWNQRQANCNVNKTTTYDWISSKLTPVDASQNCASFCICAHSCVDLNLCAIAVSLPSAANLFLDSQQLRD